VPDFREHARVEKRVINMDSGDYRYITCAWRECGRDGLEMYKARVHDHAPHIKCDDYVIRPYGPKGEPAVFPLAKHTFFVFCSHRHLMYWTHSHRPEVLDGNLPTGSRGTII
jgi:hypothetical protein